MAPKKNQKSQKMAIGDFLSDQSLGSWADEMDSQPMPAPSSGFGGERRTYGGGGGFGDRSGGFGGDRGGGFGDSDRPRSNFREQLPLPDKPPYTAHLGNLSFEVTQGDVQDFLSGCDVSSVRIVEDKLEMKPKGFGYVEFSTVDGLKKALTLSETQFQGRNIRISVAEPQRADPRELNDWSRKGPLAPLPDSGSRRPSERQGGFGGARNFDPASDAGSDRGGDRRRPGFFEGDGKTRDFGNWERKGPLSPPPGAEPRQGGRGPREYGAPREGRASPAWGEGQSEAGSRPPRREFQERPAVERAPTAADQDSQWRTKMKPDAPSPVATPDPSVPSSPAAPTAPASRPRLNLAKRTVSEAVVEKPEDSPSAASSESKASPFGAARPIDTSARDRAIEEKRQLALRQKKEQEDKAREEKKARDAAFKAERAANTEKETQPAKDSAASTPRENGNGNSNSKASDRKVSDAGAAPAAPGRQYEILRRMADEEGGADDHDGVDASANGEIVGDKETKPQEVVREAPAPGARPTGDETTADALEDDGFTVVSKKEKNTKRGGGGRALAS